jgi:hypothetical protein
MTMTDTTELTFQRPALPSECPVCGAYSLAPESSVSTVLAVCDVLVIKALEKMGNYILGHENAAATSSWTVGRTTSCTLCGSRASG